MFFEICVSRVMIEYFFSVLFGFSSKGQVADEKPDEKRKKNEILYVSTFLSSHNLDN